MRNSPYSLIAGLALGLTACSDLPPEEGAEPTVPGSAPAGESGEQFLINPNRRVLPGTAERSMVLNRITHTDDSGTVDVQVVECNEARLSGHNTNIACYVDDDFVVVGGGASITGEERSLGALLVASRPIDRQFRGWMASSKDHIHPDPHLLNVFAIGLRLAGVPADTLRQHMRLGQQLSEKTAHPAITVEPEEGYVLIGGGAQAEAPNCPSSGSLLTTTQPDGNGWRAASKDHLVGCSEARVRAFVIGIQPTIPQFGELEFARGFESIGFNTGSYKTATASLPEGFVPTSLGARSFGVDPGRMLMSLVPSGRGVAATSKDHLRASDIGVLEAFVVGVRRAPAP